MRIVALTTLSALLLFAPAPAPAAARLKELVTLEGVRDNQLIGYGLVVGLNKTGDRLQTVFSAQSLTNLLQRMGVSVPPDAIRVNNTASVMVTGTLPPFAQPGTRIDATASAIGDASSLQGGILLLTSLRSSDGQVYAVVQGPVVTGGFIAGRGGTGATVNHPTVGRVPNGAIVEREAPSVEPSKTLRLQLRNADYTTAAQNFRCDQRHLWRGRPQHRHRGELRGSQREPATRIRQPVAGFHREDRGGSKSRPTAPRAS